MEKIVLAVTNIFVDTSVLKCKNIKDFSTLNVANQFDIFMNFLKDNQLDERYCICIPEIVLEELKSQYYDSFEESVQNFSEEYNKIKDIYGIKINLEDADYKNKLNEIVGKFLIDNKIKVIPMPKEKEVFGKIIDRAIDKRKPFSGKNSESDKGFKDVLQWESIKKYTCKRHFLEKFMFLTKNSKDFVKELEIEFKNETNKEIEIFYDISEIQEKIMKLNKLESDLGLVKKILHQQIINGELDIKINEIFNRKYEDIKSKIIVDEIEDLIFVGNDTYEFFTKEHLENDIEILHWVKCKLINKKDIEIIDFSIVA